MKLILDADVSIYLKEQGLWDKVISSHEVYLAEIVAEKELQDYKNVRSFGERRTINLSSDINNNKIRIVSVDASELAEMVSIMDKTKCPRLDDGEMESLTATYIQKVPDLIFCVCDNAAIKCAVYLDIADKILPLESVLRACKIKDKCPHQYSEARFVKQIEKSKADKIQDTDFSSL